MEYIREHLQLALDQINYEKEESVCNQDFFNAAQLRDVGDLLKKAIANLPPPIIWTEVQVAMLKDRQSAQGQHPYTCGNDSKHRPLIPTKRGWICNDCNYRQFWSHETGIELRPADKPEDH